MKGTVKWFNNQKGYGFISDAEGHDVFVHYSGLNMDGFKTLEEGQEVEYEVTDVEVPTKPNWPASPILSSIKRFVLLSAFVPVSTNSDSVVLQYSVADPHQMDSPLHLSFHHPLLPELLPLPALP